MTVSPEWPQDGKRRPRAGDNGMGSGDDSRESALPPTLFKLPDLNRDQDNRQPPPAAMSPPEEGNRQPAEERLPDPPAPVDQPPAEQARQQEPAAEEPKAEDSAPPRAPLPPATDQPAGRSWMETFGSHGMVVALLLTVVAAALVSSRNPTTPSLDSLAESDAIEETSQIDTPIPSHGDDRSELVWSAEVEPYTAGPELAEQQPAAVSDSQFAQGFSSAPPTVTPSATPSSPSFNAERPLVSLEPPQATVASSAQPPTPPFDRMEPLPPDPIQVDVLPAAERSEPVDGSSSLPSLDAWLKGGETSKPEESLDQPPSLDPRQSFDLEQIFETQELAQRSAPPSPRRAARKFGSKYQYSATPRGIHDWSQYFPEYEPRKASNPRSSSTR